VLTPEEEFRRLLLLTHALWEAREELASRFQEIDVEALDWLERERLDLAIEAERRVLERYESLLLLGAYDEESSVVKCTAEERQAAVDIALGVLEGRFPVEPAVDLLLSDDFPSG
jgi:hypothetical protein